MPRSGFWGVIVLALVAAGCAGNGCACISQIPGGFPAAEREANSVQIRVSQTGLGYIESNLKDFAGLLFSDGMSFPIPQQCGGDQEVCCGAPWRSLQLDIDQTAWDTPRLELNPVASDPGRLDVVLRAKIHTPYSLPVAKRALLFWVNCNVSINSRWSGDPSIALRTTLWFDEDPTSGEMSVYVGNASVTGLSEADVDISGGLFCGFASKADVVNMFTQQFADRVGPMIQDKLCKKCETHSECAPYGQCYNDGNCYIDDWEGFRCMNAAGVSGRLAAKELLGSLAHPTKTRAIDFYAAQGGSRSTNANGLTLGMLGGALPALPAGGDTCAPTVPQPDRPAIPVSTVLKGNTHPETGAPFDVGIGVHDSYLNHFAWAAHQAGWLCLNLGSERVRMLTAKTLSLFFPSILDLYTGEDAMMYLLIRPQNPPKIALGAGTFTTDANGMKVISDALLHVAMTDMDIDFYLMTGEQWVRVLTLRADAVFPVSLDVDGAGKIVPVIGDVASAFTNLRVLNSELLAEPADELASKFPTLLAFALPMLADKLGSSSFEAPGFFGVTLDFGDRSFVSIEGKRFLGVFGDMTKDLTPGKPVRRVETTASVVKVHLPAATAYDHAALPMEQAPAVELALGGGSEWQFRIDGGFWTPFTEDASVKLQRSEMWVPGWHSIQVRGRVKGQVESLDLEGVTLPVLIDPIAPQIDLERAGAELTVEASDLVTPAEKLVARYRVDGGAWMPVALGAAGAAKLAVAAGTSRVTVAVTDEAGHTSESSVDLVGFHGNVPSDGTGCDCRVGGATVASTPEESGVGGALGGAVVAMAAGLAVALSRRRRPWTLLALVLAVSAAAALGGGCGSDNAGSDDDDDGDGAEPTGPGEDGNEATSQVVPGSIGRWGSIAGSDARVVVAAYEERYEDLVLGDVAFDGDGSVTWRTIDGVPSGPVVADPTGYRGGIKKKGDNVGAFTSVALHGVDARVAYMDLVRHSLRFAVEVAGVFTAHDVDVPATGEAGRYASLSLAADGTPGVAYLAWGIDRGDGTFGAELRWAQAATATPAATSDWTVAVIDSVQMSCSGLCAAGSQCVAATNACAAVDAAPCDPVCEDGFACMGGACTAVLTAPPAPTYPRALGLFASAGRLPDGRPVVAYYDHLTGGLFLALRKLDGSWRKVDLHADDRSDTGEHASLAVAADGRIHVVYQETVDEMLLYRSFLEGASPEKSAVETVDSGARDGERPHPVGGAASLAIDAAGGLVVVYQDGATADLLVARRGADGTWSRSDVLSGTTGYGFYNGLVSTATGLWVFTFGHEAGATDPGKPFVTRLP